MKINILFIIVCFACTAIGQQTKEIPVLSIEKSSCYGACPVYKTEIFLSGRITFEGISNTKFKGHYCTQIDDIYFKWLIETFNKKNYLSFNEVYFSHAMDLPTTTLEYNYEGKQKRVRDYDNAPAELKELEKIMETLVDTISWVKCR